MWFAAVLGVAAAVDVIDLQSRMLQAELVMQHGINGSARTVTVRALDDQNVR